MLSRFPYNADVYSRATDGAVAGDDALHDDHAAAGDEAWWINGYPPGLLIGRRRKIFSVIIVVNDILNPAVVALGQ